MTTQRGQLGYSPAALRRERQARGLSQKAVASTAGCSQPWLSQIELGDRQANPLMLLRIAAAMGCSTEDFLPRHRKRTRGRSE